MYLSWDGVPATPHVAGGTGSPGGSSGRPADLGRHRRDGRAELRPQAPGGAARPHARGRAFALERGGRVVPDRRGRVVHAGDRASSGDALPGLAMASRTVGSPQIRNRGTIGGNLGSSSPAGDALPPLYAGGAEVELCVGARRSRACRSRSSSSGPKRNVLAADELIAAVWMPRATRAAAVREGGDAQRDGDRGVLVRAGSAAGASGTCIGSAGPTPMRAREAEAFAASLDSR